MLDKTEKLEKIRQDLKALKSNKTDEKIIFNDDDIGGEDGVDKLSKEFLSLCFLRSLKGGYVMVRRKD